MKEKNEERTVNDLAYISFKMTLDQAKTKIMAKELIFNDILSTIRITLGLAILNLAMIEDYLIPMFIALSKEKELNILLNSVNRRFIEDTKKFYKGNFLLSDIIIEKNELMEIKKISKGKGIELNSEKVIEIDDIIENLIEIRLPKYLEYLKKYFYQADKGQAVTAGVFLSSSVLECCYGQINDSIIIGFTEEILGETLQRIPKIVNEILVEI